MSELTIVFSFRAKQRLENITDYLFQQTKSSVFVVNYINELELFLQEVLCLFPESGTPMSVYGKGIRRIAYKEYSFLYRVNSRHIEILTVYRENLP